MIIPFTKLNHDLKILAIWLNKKSKYIIYLLCYVHAQQCFYVTKCFQTKEK